MTGAKPEPGELMPVAQSPQLAPAGAALLETVLNGAPSDSDTPAPAAEGSDATRAKTRAAFELADTTGLAAAPHLVEAMMEQPQADGIETYRRVIGSNPHACPAALGLATLGSAAAPYVLQQMQAVLEAEASTDGEAMRSARLITACDLLGNLGRSVALLATPALRSCMGDSDWWVRRQAAEAAGRLTATGTAPQLSVLLEDENRIVRRAAAFAATQWAVAGEQAALALATEGLAFMLTDDPDRYNRGFAALALQQLAVWDAAARERLVASLMAARWCPVTNSRNPF